MFKVIYRKEKSDIKTFSDIGSVAGFLKVMRTAGYECSVYAYDKTRNIWHTVIL